MRPGSFFVTAPECISTARGVKCAIAYGLKWRGAAVAALRVLGLDPPRGFTLL